MVEKEFNTVGNIANAAKVRNHKLLFVKNQIISKFHISSMNLLYLDLIFSISGLGSKIKGNDCPFTVNRESFIGDLL